MCIAAESWVRFTQHPTRASAECSGKHYLPGEVPPGNKRHIFVPLSLVAGISWRIPQTKLRGYHVGAPAHCPQKSILLDNVSALSEARPHKKRGEKRRTVGGGRSIKPSEGSRSRVRR